MSAPRRLLTSPRAAADLEEIADYIARDNPARAASFVAELEATCQTIATFPTLHPLRNDLAPGPYASSASCTAAVTRLGFSDPPAAG